MAEVWKVFPSTHSIFSSGSNTLNSDWVSSPMPLYTDSTTMSAVVPMAMLVSDIQEMMLMIVLFLLEKR